NPINLEGDQCLVFFLGGIPAAGGGTLGVSADQADPSLGTAQRKGPYFKFESSPLFDRAGLGLYSYAGPPVTPPQGTGWVGTPYAYFSSYKQQNGYLRYAAALGSDCQTLQVSPYSEALTTRFLNPSGFQIISAGKDGIFGRGSLTTPPAPMGGPW